MKKLFYKIIFYFFLISNIISCDIETVKEYSNIDKGNIIFTIIDSDSLPVYNANISIKNNTLNVNTNIKGIAIFENVSEGKTEFIIKTLDYSTSRIIDITDSITINRTVYINYSFGDIAQINDSTLTPFFIDKYELTNKKYKLINIEHKYKDDEADQPVTNIYYKDAENYCNSIGKRLCTKEEFIKICETKSNYLYPYGKQYDQFRCNTNTD